MKKIIRIGIISLVFLCLMNISNVYASDNWSQHQLPWWQPSRVEMDVGQEEIKDKANVITTVIRNVGIAVSVIALMIIGIREMFSSAEEKSTYKESMPGYILGVVMVIAVTTLPSIIYNIAKQIK